MDIVHITEVNNNIDRVEHVEKFNPYHGKDGRFASKNGGGAGAGGSGGGFKAQTYAIGGAGTNYENMDMRAKRNYSDKHKQERGKMLRDMDRAPVGTKMQIKTSNITEPKKESVYNYTKVSADDWWMGSDGKEISGLAIANHIITPTMTKPNITGSVTIGKSDIDTIEE